MDFTVDIKGRKLEYIDETHTYRVNEVVVPSITRILKTRFQGKYDGIDKKVLQHAADMGTAVHEAIERWCKTGEESDLPEVRNFKFLMNKYDFQVEANEVPVILFMAGDPVAAGRLDLVLSIGKELGLADIKRTSKLDKEYLAYQLNLYRIAFQQCYDEEITFLRGVHLRENVRKFVEIPVNPAEAWNLVEDFINE